MQVANVDGTELQNWFSRGRSGRKRGFGHGYFWRTITSQKVSSTSTF
jgi:hypothetical protein